MTDWQSDPWTKPSGVVVLDYGGVLAPDGRSPVLDAAIGVLVELARRGAQLILASNTAPDQPRGVRTGQLRAAGVDWCFDAVLESEQLNCAKPDPRFFQLVLSEIHRLAPSTNSFDAVWVEDDDRRGIVPAIQYGLRAVWLSRERDARLTAVRTVRQIPDIALLPEVLCVRPPSVSASTARQRPASVAGHSPSTDTTARAPWPTYSSRSQEGPR